MFPALNMELEIVRIVLQNNVNDIYVCTDLLKNTGVFYTMISIRDARCRKLVAEKLNTERFFFENHDFIGSFVYESCLNLVFRYFHENLLSLLGNVYLSEFSECKKAAIGLVTACAESGASPCIGMLLLDDKNINLSKDGEITFNYFLDFSKFQPETKMEHYLFEVSQKVFGILDMNYRERYESPENYPDDLRLFYLKMTTTGFVSLGHIIAMIRSMADKLAEKKGIVWWVGNRFRLGKSFLFRNSMNAFLTILVTVTLIYAIVQIQSRIKIRRAYEKNMSYYGIEYIGNVYLGDEE